MWCDSHSWCEGVDMEFEELFGLVKEYTMEEAGIWEFFSSYQQQFRHSHQPTSIFLHLTSKRWRSTQAPKFSWWSVNCTEYGWCGREEGIQQAAKWFVPGSRHYSWDKVSTRYQVPGTYIRFFLKLSLLTVRALTVSWEGVTPRWRTHWESCFCFFSTPTYNGSRFWIQRKFDKKI